MLEHWAAQPPTRMKAAFLPGGASAVENRLLLISTLAPTSGEPDVG
jgi:hypothetical protein